MQQDRALLERARDRPSPRPELSPGEFLRQHTRSPPGSEMRLPSVGRRNHAIEDPVLGIDQWASSDRIIFEMFGGSLASEHAG